MSTAPSQSHPDVAAPAPPTAAELQALLAACGWDLNDVALEFNRARAGRGNTAQAVAHRACVPLVYAQGWIDEARNQGLIEKGK